MTVATRRTCPACQTDHQADLALCPDCGHGDATATVEQRQRVADSLAAWLAQAGPLLAALPDGDPRRPAAMARYQRRERLVRLLGLEQRLLALETRADAGENVVETYRDVLRQYEALARLWGEPGRMSRKPAPGAASRVSRVQPDRSS